jgi:transposase
MKRKNEAEKTRVLAALKQSKYALLKPEARLTDKQKVKLEEVKNLSSVSRHAWAKEEFREIFEAAEDWTDGTFKLLDWLAKVRKILKKVLLQLADGSVK